MKADQSKPTPLTDRLRGLERDWDSYGARPIQPEALAVAESMETNLCFVPTSNGGFQAEFHGAGLDVEIEVDENGEIEGVYVSKAGR